MPNSTATIDNMGTYVPTGSYPNSSTTLDPRGEIMHAPGQTG